ncbi:MAG: DUF1800 domain-containing protein [Burkholderiales bacterium]|nr:DUF1800 domain-containing protein [Burkholderiales bacterium]
MTAGLKGWFFLLVMLLLAPHGNAQISPADSRLKNDLKTILEYETRLKAATTEEQADIRKALRQWENQTGQNAIEQSLANHLTQLTPQQSKLLWFWSNHFSVHAQKGRVRLMLASLESDAIAPRAESRFPDLLRHAALHPAMLIYLDNTQNRKNKTNENLAREILELHTLGVNGGYQQNDVLQLAAALTGIGIADLDKKNTHLLCQPPECIALNPYGTVLRPKAHATGPKTLLGKTYPDRDGLAILEMLNDLALHPSTAKRLSLKLSQYFLGDHPSASEVNNISESYLNSGGDLRQVLATIKSAQARMKPAESRLKDPFLFLTDAIRALRPEAFADQNINTRPIANALKNLGMPHFGRISPDGYPLISDAWNNNTTLLQRLQISRQIINQYPRIWPDSSGRTEFKELVDRIEPRLSPESAAAIREFKPRPAEWLTMALMTPEFMFH